MNLADCCCQSFYFLLCLFFAPMALRLNFEKDSFLQPLKRKEYFYLLPHSFFPFSHLPCSPSTAERQFDDYYCDNARFQHSTAMGSPPKHPDSVSPRFSHPLTVIPLRGGYEYMNGRGKRVLLLLRLVFPISLMMKCCSFFHLFLFCFLFCFVYLFACFLPHQCQGWTLKSFVDCLLRLISLIADSHQ